jgi:predicted nucleic acid-binding protein
MVIVDTTVWIDYFGGNSTPQVEWLEKEMTRQRLGITDIILCEVLQGVRDDGQFDKVRDALLCYEVFSMGGVDLALAAAQNYRALRAQGITVRKTIDCMIATFCLQNNHTLLHNDRDFESFEIVFGLQVIHNIV